MNIFVRMKHTNHKGNCKLYEILYSCADIVFVRIIVLLIISVRYSVQQEDI